MTSRNMVAANIFAMSYSELTEMARNMGMIMVSENEDDTLNKRISDDELRDVIHAWAEGHLDCN